MPLIFREKNTKSDNGILSATKPQNVILSSTNQAENKNLQSMLKQKVILNVYVDKQTNKMFVTTATAHALGITNVRSIMTGTDKLYEITIESIQKYKNRFPNIDVEINQIILETKKKDKIKLYFTKENKFYIDYSTSYALNFISDSDFANNNMQYYGPLAEFEINFIKNKYDVEITEISIFENENNDIKKK